MTTFDIALAIEFIYKAAQYYGSLTSNTKEAYDALDWIDERAKPTWVELEAAAVEMSKPNIEQLTAEAFEKRDELLTLAAIRIAPLQDAVDLGDSSAEDEALLLKWKRYRVDVNRIDRQSGFPLTIDWPIAPD